MNWILVNDRPIYIQLTEQITQYIVAGIFKPGTRMASVRDLAADAGVNPNTMQRAMAELERNGLVKTHRTTGIRGAGDVSIGSVHVLGQGGLGNGPACIQLPQQLDDCLVHKESLILLDICVNIGLIHQFLSQIVGSFLFHDFRLRFTFWKESFIIIYRILRGKTIC